MEDPLALAAQQTERAPIVYFNGFTIGVGNADFTIQLRIENAERAVLKCSYTVAKTLAEKLTGVVQRFEKATHHNLMTTEQVAEAMIAREKELVEETPKAKSEDESKSAK